MRIAFLTPEYVTEPNFDGGLANYLHRVACGMQQFGHDVEVFTLSASDGVIVHDGVHVNRVRIDERMLGRCNRLTRTKFPMTLRALFAAFHLSRRFRERHRELIPLRSSDAASPVPAGSPIGKTHREVRRAPGSRKVPGKELNCPLGPRPSHEAAQGGV